MNLKPLALAALLLAAAAGAAIQGSAALSLGWYDADAYCDDALAANPGDPQPCRYGAVEGNCADDVDNDSDEATDCLDADCADDPRCVARPVCARSELDVDGDCADDSRDPMYGELDLCADGTDGDADGYPDGCDLDCPAGAGGYCAVEDCRAYADEDGDGAWDGCDMDCAPGDGQDRGCADGGQTEGSRSDPSARGGRAAECVPEPEVYGDGVDQDCDGADAACPWWDLACRLGGGGGGAVCGDGQCDAGEGCAADCGYCGDGTCNNGEDCGGCAGDCGACGDDDECSPGEPGCDDEPPSCDTTDPSETSCSDSCDNDADGFTDCDDDECKGLRDCGGKETDDPDGCFDQGLDNDQDGATECDDLDCIDHPACSPSGKCCVCTYGDETGDGGPDGRDACVLSESCEDKHLMYRDECDLWVTRSHADSVNRSPISECRVSGTNQSYGYSPYKEYDFFYEAHSCASVEACEKMAADGMEALLAIRSVKADPSKIAVGVYNNGCSTFDERGPAERVFGETAEEMSRIGLGGTIYLWGNQAPSLLEDLGGYSCTGKKFFVCSERVDQDFSPCERVGESCSNEEFLIRCLDSATESPVYRHCVGGTWQEYG